jgi:hypothetical protein
VGLTQILNKTKLLSRWLCATTTRHGSLVFFGVKYMKGANEYSQLFKTGQYGRLYIESSTHARGRTFKIKILPKGEAMFINGKRNPNAVEVYGVVAGTPGWTEEYGWLHNGKWQDDFNDLVNQRRMEIEQLRKESEKTKEQKAIEAHDKKMALLRAYDEKVQADYGDTIERRADGLHLIPNNEVMK